MCQVFRAWLRRAYRPPGPSHGCASFLLIELTFVSMTWLIHNRRVGAYYHPDNRQGTYTPLDRAHRFEDRAEAERVCDRLNEKVIHGGEALRDDGWEVVPLCEGGRGRPGSASTP